MHPQRKKRLALVLAIVIATSVGIGLMTYALSNNINLFYEPTRVANGEAPIDKTIRVGGMVVKGSVERDPQTLDVAFVLTDYSKEVPVRYSGILPDLFSEQEGAVATGKLSSDGVFYADQVLAKHDEKYMPPEVAKALEKSSINQ